MNFGKVIIRNDNDFVINVTDTDCGYNVVPKSVDPFNKYNIEDVRQYVIDYPEMVIIENKDKDILKSELNGLQAYLNSSDYIGTHYGEILTQESKATFLDNISTTFNMSNMNILIKREEARDRIDELRTLLI